MWEPCPSRLLACGIASCVLSAGIASGGPDAPDAADARSRETHWAFVTPARPAVPATNSAWVRTPVDAFILDRLQPEGLAPSPEADRRTLIRRLSLDLTGLPPAPAAVEAFVNDTRDDAY